ncbi:MAG: ATP-binding cassette domain-containing protein [Clostridia bacterium]|nr:ATP-binding cassette domain-containing protein [Clostridia bacterium]
MIEIKNLEKTYPTANGGFTAIQNINLSIADGDIFGIIGLSGAGKSTLVRCINLLEVPTKGEVIIDGRSMTSLSRKELLRARQSIGMIFQGFNLLSQRNSIDNITFPLEIAGVSRAKAVKRAVELLELVGLSDKAKSFPSQLSGGQKQRVAIARALATNPKVLLCDEATSALDPTTTVQILELLKEINQKLGVTIVVITHEMRVIEKICNRLAVIDSSEIAEQGLVSEVFKHPKTAIARKLIMPQGGEGIESALGKQCIRLTFDGADTEEPFISMMTMECRAAVSILFANTKSLDGKTYGQMVLQLPADEDARARILAFLEKSGYSFTEEVYAG